MGVEVNCRNGNAIHRNPRLLPVLLDASILPKVEAQPNPATAIAAPYTPHKRIQTPPLQMAAPGTIESQHAAETRARQVGGFNYPYPFHELIITRQTTIALSLEMAKSHDFSLR